MDYRKEFEEETKVKPKDSDLEAPRYAYKNKDAYIRWLEERVDVLKDKLSKGGGTARMAPAPGMQVKSGIQVR